MSDSHDPGDFMLALRGSISEVADLEATVGEYRFNFEDIPTEITVRLVRRPGTTQVFFRLSHAIQTPAQAGPYLPTSNGGTIESEVREAIEGLAVFYRQGQEAGHSPDETWLVPTPS